VEKEIMRNNPFFIFFLFWIFAGNAAGETPTLGGTDSNLNPVVSKEQNQVTFPKTTYGHSMGVLNKYLASLNENPKNIEDKLTAVSAYTLRHNSKYLDDVTIIRTEAGWNEYWSKLRQTLPKAPTDFKNRMVLEIAYGHLREALYRKTETLLVLAYPAGHGGMNRDWSKYQPPPPTISCYFLRKTDLPIRLLEIKFLTK
jgi:hypothetical protein